METEGVDTDRIIDCLLGAKDKERKSESRLSEKAEAFRNSLIACLEQAKTRPELTFVWGRKFWSGKRLLGGYRVDRDGEWIRIQHGPARSDKIECHVSVIGERVAFCLTYHVATGWSRPDSESDDVSSVSDAFALVMKHLVNADNRCLGSK